MCHRIISGYVVPLSSNKYKKGVWCKSVWRLFETWQTRPQQWPWGWPRAAGGVDGQCGSGPAGRVIDPDHWRTDRFCCWLYPPWGAGGEHRLAAEVRKAWDLPPPPPKVSRLPCDQTMYIIIHRHPNTQQPIICLFQKYRNSIFPDLFFY